MTVKVTQPSINLREKISEVDKPSGIAGEAILRSETPQEVFNYINAGRRNLIINGAMQVAQRGTSFSQAGTPQYTIDRFEAGVGASFDWNSTITQSSTAPAGFGSSLKVDVDTVSTPTSGQNAAFFYKIEAQDLQQLNFGTANAESLTISFWVRSNKTGTYCLQIIQADASKGLLYEYEISSANTWEKKTITFSGNTADQINNDNGRGIDLFWSLACVSGDHRSASTTWTADVGGGIRATSNQVNLMDNTANEWYITGVQLEAGKVATPFEHRSYGEELALCQRYFQKIGSISNASSSQGMRKSSSFGWSHEQEFVHFTYHVPMRATPSRHSATILDSNISGDPFVTRDFQETITETTYNANVRYFDGNEYAYYRNISLEAEL